MFTTGTMVVVNPPQKLTLCGIDVNGKIGKVLHDEDGIHLIPVRIGQLVFMAEAEWLSVASCDPGEYTSMDNLQELNQMFGIADRVLPFVSMDKNEVEDLDEYDKLLIETFKLGADDQLRLGAIKQVIRDSGHGLKMARTYVDRIISIVKNQ